MEKQYDVIICLPSLNEEDSIVNVAKQIDKGLKKYFPDRKALILNIDSNSEDSTVKAFTSAKTKTEKLSIVNKEKGKGRNLLRLFEFAKNVDAKYIATIDADLTSISSDWLKLMLTPLIDNVADYIVPVYKRNKYEGNTTNHFCFPILSAYLDTPIRQPYAGDFAFRRSVSDYWLVKKRIDPINYYGIDIFMTMYAVIGDFRVKEIYLGSKIHKPSYGKMVPMFKQAAATVFMILSEIKLTRVNKKIQFSNELEEYRFGIDEFIRKPNEVDINNNIELSVNLLGQFIQDKNNPLKDLHIDLLGEFKTNKGISSDKWVEYLSNTIGIIMDLKESDFSFERLGEFFLPFYLLRVTSYFNEIDGIDNHNVNIIIENQADKLRSKVLDLLKQ